MLEIFIFAMENIFLILGKNFQKHICIEFV